MPTEGRGVLASYGDVTRPVDGRRTSDISKSRLTVRDVILLVVGAASMWGTQVATQWRTQSAIDTLGTKFDGYVQKQSEANIEFQRQLDEVRKTANLGVVTANSAEKEAARLEGILLGAGIKGVRNEQR
jgi:hypothetical protein